MEEQNAKNLAKVKDLIDKSEKIRLGGELKEGVAIDFTSMSGNKYKGTVIFKRPTMQDYMKMGALKSEYFRAVGIVDLSLVDVAIKRIAQVMAVLSTIVVKCPDWMLDLNSIVEPEVLYHVYDKYEEWENSFRKSNNTELTGDSTTTK